jgi:predicted amidohydrolase YtcJ
MHLPRASLLFTGVRPWSAEGVPPGADAVAVAGGRILAVGSARELAPLAGPGTRHIQGEGRTLTPGLTDAHLHFVSLARAGDRVALGGLASRAEAVAAVARFAERRADSTVLRGQGWDANRWSEQPDRAALDAVTGDRPALLESKDCHSLWANGAALRRAGITRDTPDPPGGRVERDAAGEPTGVLRESAVRLVQGLLPDSDFAADLAAARGLATECLGLGLTGVHVFEGAHEQRVLAAMARGGGPRVRVLAQLAHAGLEGALAAGVTSGVGDEWFRIGAVKLFADGALGSRTAAMLEPYEGEGHAGIETLTAAELRGLVRRAAEGGLACAVHAIGDRANRNALDAFAAAGARLAGVALPPRIEHAQILHPDDLPRFAALGVVASMQPIHCTSDLELADRHWGARSRTAYAWRSLLASGAGLAFGSDAPVETAEPVAGLHAAVTRRRRDGGPAGGWYPEQCLSLHEALAAYTTGAARAAGEAGRGRLAAGAAADLVLWSTDLFSTPADRLPAARADVTVLAGDVVCERAGAEAAAR